jgi:Carboxypeptidase regulatory-like domain/TonB dependent receptor
MKRRTGGCCSFRIALSSLSALCFALLIFLAISRTAWGQFSSSIEGTVTDTTGAVVADVTVRVTNDATGVSFVTKTSSTGNYRVPVLPAGQYRVEASKEGFTTVVQADVVLDVAKVQSVPFQLAVGSVNTKVTVTGAPPVVETSEAHISELTTAQEVLDLPLEGRNALNVIAQTPGVTGSGLVSDRAGANDIFNATSAPSVTANGQRGSSNGFYVDDTSVNDNPDGGSAKLTPNVESIQEVRVSVNNYSAQYGRNSSVLTQIITKSGTNEIHGSLFEYHTDNKLTARNVFQNTPDPITGRIVPVSRRNEFGGSLGMPIRKDHTFVFGSYDQLKSAQAFTGTYTVETSDFTNFMKTTFPNNIATKLLSTYPAAVGRNGTPITVAAEMATLGLGACSGTNSIGMPCTMPLFQAGVLSTSNPRNGIQWNTRVDQIFGNGSNRLYANVFRMTASQSSPSPRPAFTTNPPAEVDYANVNFTHVFSPTLVNEAAMGFTLDYGASPVNHPSVPAINVTGITGFGAGWGPAGFVQNDFHWRDMVSYNRGSHSFKFGFDIFRDQDNAPFSGPLYRPTFNFQNVFDFATDKPFSETGINFNAQTGGLPFQNFGYRSTTYGFYVQDDWKVRRTLTLNLGLRWDFSGNPTEANGDMTNLQLGSGATLAEQIAGAKVVRVKQMFTDDRKGYFAPRLGFAWDPTGQGKLSVRSGFGVFFDRWPNKVWSDATRNNPPFVASATASVQNPTGPPPVYALGTTDTAPYGFVYPPITPGLNPAGGPTGYLASVGGADQAIKYAYAENWFFGVQYSPLPGWVAEADYVGSVGRHLYTVIDRNRFAGDLIQNQNTLHRLNPYFATVNYGDNSASSSYNGGTVSVRKIFSKNYTFQTSYTLGKAIDEVNAVGPGSGAVYAEVIDAYNVGAQRGLSPNDVRQKVALNFVAHLPTFGAMAGPVRYVLGGWEASSLAIFQSGLPATVFTSAAFVPVWNDPSCATTVTPSCRVVGNTGGDYNGDGNTYDLPMRPSFSLNRTYSRSDYLKGLFPASAFPAPALGQEGNVGRNTVHGPGMAQVDFSLLRNFKTPWFHEHSNLQFRGEIYNLFNRVNLNSFDGDITSGTFGKATGVFTPRSIQLGARLEF